MSKTFTITHVLVLYQNAQIYRHTYIPYRTAVSEAINAVRAILEAAVLAGALLTNCVCASYIAMVMSIHMSAHISMDVAHAILYGLLAGALLVSISRPQHRCPAATVVVEELVFLHRYHQ